MSEEVSDELIASAKRTPRKIAIVGGGVGAITAAWSLATSDTPVEITVYQMGWRLGGKGASGRNLDPAYSARIEEHGVHVWSGLYENAFRAMREAYETLGRAPDAPLAGTFDAFLPHDVIVLDELWKGQWLPWVVRLPTNAQLPGNADAALLPSLWAFATEAVRFITGIIQGLFDPTGTALADKTGTPTTRIDQGHQSVLLTLVERIATQLALVITEALVPVWRVVLALVHEALELLWKIVEPNLDDTGVRRAWIMVNFAFANLRGATVDNVFEHGFDGLDEQDYRAWLAKYAADDNNLMLDSPWAYFMYDAEFAYVDGDTNKPDIGAGVSLRTLIRMAFTWKGALIWKMQAGMGDTVFAPFYLALKKLGVKFEYFRRVKSLHLGGLDGCTVTSMEVELQAITKGEYDPLVTVKGLPCWPSDTLWDQIEEPTDRAIDFEDPASPSLETYTLTFGKDYDAIVLATPVATLPTIAAELVAKNPRWKAMVEHTKTVRTQGLQLWLKPTAYELGWTTMGQPLLSGFHRSPLNTWADMSYLINRESWPFEAGRSPLNLAYFCGPLLTTPDPIVENERVVTELLRDGIGWQFPNATVPHGSAGPLDFSLLVDNRPEPGEGEARVQAQYLRVNYWPSELFTLSVHGSMKHRIAPGETGFHNLVIAGDWTDNGFNIGNVEATTMSGMLASNALVGYPKRKDILGVDFGRSKPPRSADE
ncbi:MAG: NAD(P)-binding protein [Deltaproteobacteria bacterium]|nr:NAD(P)-binding protein [Deltaproteobacteria bacterium]